MCEIIFLYTQKHFYHQRKLIEEQLQKEREEYRKSLDRTLEEENVSKHKRNHDHYSTYIYNVTY